MVKTQTRKEPEGASARERLLEAANELFYEEGVHTVGIDRIIEKAGVAKAQAPKNRLPAPLPAR